MKHNLIKNSAISLSLILGISTVCNASETSEVKVQTALTSGVGSSASPTSSDNPVENSQKEVSDEEYMGRVERSFGHVWFKALAYLTPEESETVTNILRAGWHREFEDSQKRGEKK